MKALLTAAIFLAIIAAACAMSTASAKAWATQRTYGGAKLHGKGGYHPSPMSWSDLVTYSVVVDRFNNGNLSNDHANMPAVQVEADRKNSSDNIWLWRHGGDLKGIEDRLDYLLDLGVDTIWVSPVMQSDGDYHGYCVVNPTLIDPGFGTQADFISLVAEAHKRGMYVVMDIILNHLCDNKTAYLVSPNHAACPPALSRDFWAGKNNSQSEYQGKLNFSDTFFLPFQNQMLFSRCGGDTLDERRSDTDAAVYGDYVYEMFDYDTRNPDFHELFTELHKFWIALADIDGYHMDAKHITEDFVAYFSTEIRKYALSVGKVNFLVVGEVAAVDPAWIGRRLGNMYFDTQNPSKHGDVPETVVSVVRDLQHTYSRHPLAKYPGLSAIYDFAESGISRRVILGQQESGGMEAYFNSAYYNTIASQGDYKTSWTLLEMHDWPRFANEYPMDSQVAVLGFYYLLSGPGTPIVYYGQEQGFNGRCAVDSVHGGDASQSIWDICNGNSEDSLKRQDMFIGGPWRLAATTFNMTSHSWIGRMKAVPSPAWQVDPFLDRTSDVYSAARRMIHLRKSCSALRNGTMMSTWVSHNKGGVYAFLRKNSVSQIVVIINSGSNWADIGGMRFYIDHNITPASGTAFRNVLSPAEQLAYTGYDGSIAYLYTSGHSVPPHGAMIFVDKSQLVPTDVRLGISLCAV